MIRDCVAFALLMGLLGIGAFYTVGPGAGLLQEDRQQLYFVRRAADDEGPLAVTPAILAEQLPGAKLLAMNEGEWPFTPEIRGLWVTLVVPGRFDDATVCAVLGTVEGAEGCSIYRP